MIQTFKVTGMSCASCASSIEKATRDLPYIRSLTVNFATEKLSIDLIDADKLESLKKVLSDIGFGIEDENSSSPSQSGLEGEFRKFVISFILALCLFALAMWPLMSWPNQSINWWIQLLICFPIWGIIGWKFQKSVLTFFRTGRSNMNTLIGLGTSSAFIYSSFITILPTLSLNIGLTQRVYFEAVGFIISFVYLGQYFEQKAKRKTKDALNSLFKLSAKHANVLVDGAVLQVEASKLEIGNLIRVKPGEKFPVDGIIVTGSSAINEAMLTGEPIPTIKSDGDSLFAGTINGDSVIDYRATKVGGDTFLAQIITFVEKAQNSKPEIQKYADRISGYFTPVVIIVSVVTFFLWLLLGPEPAWGNAISTMIAVLVIACPCALGLATPTAVVVATGKASLNGLLIGGGEVLEKGVNIDLIIFDKTGTITEGRPSVIGIEVDGDQDVLLRDLASIEQFSEHPLSKAVVDYAGSISLSEPDSFEVIKGKGIIAELAGATYHIGNESLFNDYQIRLNQNIILKNIGSDIFVAKNSQHIAHLVVGDKVKDSARDTIAAFKQQGIKTWMITGDNERVAAAVAKELDIDHYLSQALPLMKSEKITELQSQGFHVAMIGDGVNDAPALAKADLSLAMGTGTDVAMNASDVTIVHGDISKALDFLALCHQTMKIIKQNLFLSLIYNSILVPIAAGLLVLFGGPLMPPVFASIAMALSSISVVSNSLRIARS